MQSAAERNRRAINLWTARLIPIVLAGVVGYATYVLVVLLCGMCLWRCNRMRALMYVQSITC